MTIDRRTLLAAAGVATLGGSTAFLLTRNRAPDMSRRPRANLHLAARRDLNVLFILTDQERANHLLPQVPLPRRDQLIARSTVFRNAMAVTNLCSTSRGTIYTGLHPQVNGLWDNTPLPFAGDLRLDVPTLGTMMQDAGFATGYFGKWHLSSLPEGKPIGADSFTALVRRYGFDETDQDGERDGPHYGYRFDPETAKSAAAFVRRHKGGDRPWFAAVNFVNPHDIMFLKTSEEQERSRAIKFPGTIEGAPDDPLYARNWSLDLPQNFGDATLAGKPAAQREMRQVMALSLGEIPYSDVQAWRDYQNYYANCLIDVDRWIGFLLDALEETGQADDTIVVFSADHGEMGGVHGLREKGANLYREASNVPFWIIHPDVGGGVETDALASLVDIAPTLLGLVGIDRDVVRNSYPSLSGFDLSPALGASAARTFGAGGRTAALGQWTSLIHQSSEAVHAAAKVLNGGGPVEKLGYLFDERRRSLGAKRGAMRGLYDGRYKFARYFSPRDHHRPSSFLELVARNDLELYDTAADPGEKVNLAADPVAADRQLIEMLNARLNDLIAAEVGVDDGSFLPGPGSLWAV
jgi:arylsulfatase